MNRVLLCLLLLASSVFAQEQVYPIRDFRGLNTMESDFTIKPNESRGNNNTDPGRVLGAITKRFGYDSISVKSATDSLMGILGITWEDGTSQLVIATDDSAKAYGGIYLVPKGSVNLDSATRIWDYWSAQGKTNFTVFQDRLYAVNGLQKGFVYERQGNQNIVHSLPIQAPGEPLVTPVSVGNLSGEYRYCFLSTTYRTPGSAIIGDNGYVSGPYKTNGGGFALRWFQDKNPDTLASTVDSVHVLIYRTKKNPGRLDELDTCYYTGLWFTNTTDAVVIDTVQDSLLTTARPLQDKEYRGVDSTNHTKVNRYGSPGFKSRDIQYYTHAGDTGKLAGIFYGTPYTTDHVTDSVDSARFDHYNIGVAYTTTFNDSVLNMESDTGRSLFVYDDTANGSIKDIRISLPKMPDSVTNLMYRIYRAHLLWVARDTSILLAEYNGIIGRAKAYDLANKHSERYVVQDPNNPFKWRVFERSLVNDTILLGPYHMVAQISGDSSYYTDSLRYDSLILNPIFHRSVPPPLLKALFPYEGRIFGYTGSNLYWSFPDTGGAWGTFDFVSVNNGDGQEIMTAFPARNVIRILKNKSSWNLYQDANLDWSLTEVSSKVGAIATNSYQRGMNGHYYLSEFGVIQENEGQYLERTQATNLVSAKLKNLDQLPITTKRNAKSFYVDQTYLLSIGDTTYVYSEKADAWATWTNFKIGGATMFRKASQVDFIAPDTMYFYKPNGKTLFRYKSSEKDVNTAITWQWLTPTLLLTPDHKTLRGLGTFVKCDTAVSLGGYFYNEKGTLLDFSTLYNDVSNRYNLKAPPTTVNGLGFAIKYANNNTTKIVIDGLDVYYTVDGRFRRK